MQQHLENIARAMTPQTALNEAYVETDSNIKLSITATAHASLTAM